MSLLVFDSLWEVVTVAKEMFEEAGKQVIDQINVHLSINGEVEAILYN